MDIRVENKKLKLKKRLKSKVLPLHAMQAYRESRGTAPLIPNLGTR
jgi:hypothetical protein